MIPGRRDFTRNHYESGKGQSCAAGARGSGTTASVAVVLVPPATNHITLGGFTERWLASPHVPICGSGNVYVQAATRPSHFAVRQRGR